MVNDAPKRPTPPPEATKPKPAPTPAERKVVVQAQLERERAKMVATVAGGGKPDSTRQSGANGGKKAGVDGTGVVRPVTDATRTGPRPADAKAKGGADGTGAKSGDRHAYPVGPTELAADLQRSPVAQLQQAFEKKGYTPDKIAAVKQFLRDNPQACAQLGKSVQDTAVWRDFAKSGQVPWERYRPPSPEVDGLLHKGLGRGAGEYISQRDLDHLAKDFGSGEAALREKGLSSRETEAVGRYLRETGRSLGDERSTEQKVMTSDGRVLPKDEAVQHDRERMIAATVKAPITVGIWGDSVESAERAAALVENLEGFASAAGPTAMARADRTKAAGTPRETRGPVRGESTVRPTETKTEPEAKTAKASPTVRARDSAGKQAATDIPEPAAKPNPEKVRDGGVNLGGAKDGAKGRAAPESGAKTDGPKAGPAPLGPDTKGVSGYDAQTMQRGGVEKITKFEPDAFGARTVEIDGKLLEPVKDRKTNPNVPNYNGDQVWKDLKSELGLKNYEAAHLWGPGFGDEAAAGMMLAPRQVNQFWQNQGAEAFLRRLGDQAREAGGQVRVTAKATSHGRDVRGGDALLAQVTYRFTVVDRSGKPVETKEVGFSVGPPPHGRVHDRFARTILRP